MFFSDKTVNIAEHQRSILATMGIDVWVPRVDVRAENYIAQNYRDVATTESEMDLVLNFDVPQKEIEHRHIVERDLAVVDVPLHKDHAEQSKPINEIRRQPEQAQAHSLPALQINSFHLQLYALEHCILLTDATELNDAQRQLWRNIQLAIQGGREAELNWPFPLLNIQDGRGATQYIQGFIDVYRQESPILCLGEIPHLAQDDCIQLASLQEMLNQPALKAKLWQAMQPKKQ